MHETQRKESNVKTWIGFQELSLNLPDAALTMWYLWSACVCRCTCVCVCLLMVTVDILSLSCKKTQLSLEIYLHAFKSSFWFVNNVKIIDSLT